MPGPFGAGNLAERLRQYWNGQPFAPMQGESNLGYGISAMPFQVLRALDTATSNPNGPGGTGAWLGGETEKAFRYATAPATGRSVPATPPAMQRGISRGSGPGNSFRDSGWSSLEQKAAANVGMPQLASMLFAVRTAGERSNNDQVSSAGARTVYQITPQTRDLFKKKYGVDAYASPQDAATVAALHLKESIQRGGDPIREYIGGPDQSKWGPQTAAYGARVGSALGAFGQAADAVGLNSPPPAFNGSGYQTADNILGQVQQNAMKPFSATYQDNPLPDLPKPDALQTPDYSAGDAAFAAAAPKNPFGATPEEQAHGQLKMRRANYFAGMAQALASIDWSHGPGLGELFAKLGAGALMGAKAGDDEVRERQEKFDNAMQGYQLAVANRDDSKAREMVNIANQNVQQMNIYKRDLWTTQAKEIEKFDPVVQDGVLITKTKQPDGTVKETHTPIDPARTASIMMARANNAVAAASAHNEYDWQNYRMNRELAGAALPYAMADATSQNNPAGRDGAFALGLGDAANAVTETGRWGELYTRYLPGGKERMSAVQREAYAQAGLQVDQDGALMPGQKIDKDTQERMNAYISTQLITDFVNARKSWVLVGHDVDEKGVKKYMPPSDTVGSAVAQQRAADRKVRTTTNAKGQTTTSESY